MSRELLMQAMFKFAAGAICVGLLIFVPAGTLAFWNGWLLMGILFIPMFFAGIVMMRKNPELGKERLGAKEKKQEQRLVYAAVKHFYRCRSCVSVCIFALCGSASGKHVSVPNH